AGRPPRRPLRGGCDGPPKRPAPVDGPVDHHLRERPPGQRLRQGRLGEGRSAPRAVTSPRPHAHGNRGLLLQRQLVALEGQVPMRQSRPPRRDASPVLILTGSPGRLELGGSFLVLGTLLALLSPAVRALMLVRQVSVLLFALLLHALLVVGRLVLVVGRLALVVGRLALVVGHLGLAPGALLVQPHVGLDGRRLGVTARLMGADRNGRAGPDERERDRPSNSKLLHELHLLEGPKTRLRSVS